MSGYVIVCKDEGKEDVKVELPTEENGCLILSVLQSQFEGATGLKYKNPETGSWRAVRISDNILHPPSEEGWGTTTTYVVVGSVKGGGDSDESGSGGERGERSGRGSSRGLAGQKRSHYDDYDYSSKAHCQSPTSYYQEAPPPPASSRAGDLIVLGLHYDVEEAELKEYFEHFGEVESAEVKRDHMTHRSRGFGFLRFKDPSIHSEVMKMPHTIRGRRCELRPPRKGNGALPCKFFIGCLPTNPDTTADELRAYFAQYGHISDVFIPKPYRGFGFVTFLDGSDGHRMYQEVHVIRNSRLNVSIAEPRAGSGGGSHMGYRREGGGGGGGGAAVSSGYSSYGTGAYASTSSQYAAGTQLYAIVPSYAAAQYYSTGGRTS